MTRSERPISSSFPPWSERRLVVEGHERRVRRSLVLFVALVVGWFLPGASWSPVSRFCLTRAIVEHQTLEITPFAPSTGDRAQVGDRFFSDKAPVPSLMAVPAYGAFFGIATARHRVPAFIAEGTPTDPARRVMVSPAFRNGLYLSSLSSAGLAGVVLVWTLYRVLRRRVSIEAAALGSAATVLGTPLFPYATSFFGHTVAAAFLFGAFALEDPLGDKPHRHRHVACGALLALAAGSEYLAALGGLVVAAFAIVASPREERGRTSLHLAVGALVPLALLGAYHAACFGAPWRTGYAFVTHPAFAAGQASGFFGITLPRIDALFGILFGGARGLFYLSPITLAGVVAGAVAFRTTRDPALGVGALIFVLLVLVNASYFMWDGGRALGPRHVVPALGFFGIPIGYAFDRWRIRVAVVAGVSVALVVLATAVGVEAPSNVDVIFGYLLPAVGEGKIARVAGASNWAILLGMGRRESLLPLGVLLVLGSYLLARLAAYGAPDSWRGSRR